MNFRDYAAKEASASVRRAFTRSADVSRQELDAVRSALDAATKALALRVLADRIENGEEVPELRGVFEAA